MLTNKSGISSATVSRSAKISGVAGLIALILFTLTMLISSISHADGLFDFQMKMAMKGGNPEAEFKVGEMYETGFGTKKDMVEAEKWITKAANQGHETANFKLLYWDVEKNGINDSNKEKVDELKAKAKAGNPQAEYYVGKMLAYGVGLKQNPDKALKWLNKAALVGVLAAEREMVVVREMKDKNDAAKKKAADKKRAQKKERDRKAKLEAQRKAEADKKAAAAAAAASAVALENKKKADAAAKAEQDAANQKRVQAERDAKAKQKADAERAEAARLAEIKKQEEEEKRRNAKFESDPCSGKSARFLSTCK